MTFRWLLFVPFFITETVLILIALVCAVTSRVFAEALQVVIAMGRTFPDRCWYTGGPFHRASAPQRETSSAKSVQSVSGN